MVPELIGDYPRIGFHKLTLSECSLVSRVSFGSFFAHREAALGANVYISCNCIIGRATIGRNTQIASVFRFY
jgi:serine acetyltransferase